MAAGRPLSVDDLIQLVGEKSTLRLLKHFAGRRLPTANRWLADRRKRAIVGDYRRGYPDSEIAAKYSVSTKWVRHVITEALRARRRAIIEQGEDPWIVNLSASDTPEES